jgi:P4 family phage/plasmid primase-like protien
MSLFDILEKCRTNGTHFSHVSLDNPRGKFSIDSKTRDVFYNSYMDGIKNGEIVCLAENPHSNLPVLVDFDIKLKHIGQIVNEKLYTIEQVKEIIGVYQSTLRKIVEDITDLDLICILLEKDLYTVTKNNNTYYKNGFHLHFPFLFLSSTNQSIHLIPRVKQIIKEKNTFANLDIADSSTLIDKAVCTNAWLMYGSRKNAQSKAYEVTKIFDSSLEEVGLEVLEQLPLLDQNERLINTKGNVKYFLPRILSINSLNKQVKNMKRSLISPLKEEIKKRRPEKDAQNHNDYTVNEALEMAKQLMPMISDARASDYNQWMSVGWALYNISEGDSRGLDLWCEFSSRCPESYDEASCIDLWYYKMVKKGITMGTLKHYAKQDSPEEYKKFKFERSQKHLTESLKGGHTDIARILKEEYGDEFVCASVANKLWFQFVNNKWEEIEEGVFLREKLSTEIIELYNKAIKDLFDKIAKANQEDEAVLNEKVKKIHKIMGNLKSNSFKSAVMKEACDIFYDRKFKHKLDSDAYLIAFKNGVYDLNSNVFRPGRPEDYLSKCMPIDYVNYDESDKKVQEIYSFLEKIFPDKSVRNYFMDTSSDVFVGGNHQKVGIFWTGEGDNGKSVTQSFFEQMLGPLAIKFNTSLITGKTPSSGSAYPDLARAGGGVRWAVLEEPNGDEMINCGTFKHLTGNDSFYARDLFEKGKDGREINPLFKLTFICNKLPKLKYADRATWNRVRVIPFESTFSSDYPESYEEQLNQKRFPVNKEFGKKIPDLLSAFAWVLLEHRKTITIRIEPEKVKKATEFYKKTNDIYRQFTDEFIEDKNGASLTITELYMNFKEWHRESLPGHSVPIKSELKEYYTKLWGEPDKGSKWIDKAFITIV